MRVYVHTHGCRLNAAESRYLIEQLESNGYTITKEMDETVDIAIVNSCSVTDQAESKCKQTIRQIIRINSEVILIITGCMAEKNPQILLNLHHRLLILGNAEKHNILAHLQNIGDEKIFPTIIHPPLPQTDFAFSCDFVKNYNRRYNLKIQEGCDFCCSYCIIPKLRGRSRSREFKNLLKDAALHVQRGAKEIILTGVNIGAYNNDSKNLFDVIAELNDIPGLHRIRLSSIELKTIDDNVLAQMADPKNKLVKYIHLPIQSGSDRILKLMRRHYTLSESQQYLDKIARYIPNVGLGTDLIVGFPGENEEDFESSIRLVQESALQYAHVFSYSRRDGTVADLMKKQFVAPHEIDRRSKILREISRKKHSQFLEQQIGKIEEVLFEDRGKIGFPGFTENYIKVLVKNDFGDLTNQIRKVRLVKNYGTFMACEIVN